MKKGTSEKNLITRKTLYREFTVGIIVIVVQKKEMFKIYIETKQQDQCFNYITG